MRIRTNLLLSASAAMILLVACGSGGGGNTTTTTPPPTPVTKLVYTDPVAGTYRLVRNAPMSNDQHLVLELVGPASDTGSGVAVSLQATTPHLAWANVNASDAAGTYVANGTTFSLGSAPQILKGTVSGDTLKAVASEKSLATAKSLGSVLLRVALDLKAGTSPTHGTVITPSALPAGCKIMQGDGTTKAIAVSTGTVTISIQ